MTTLGLLIALLLILLNAFFVLAEFSLVKVRSTRLEELARSGDKRARLAQKAVADIDGYLSSIQLGITMASLGLGWVGEPAAAALLGKLFPGAMSGLSTAMAHTISFVLAFGAITSVHVIMGEQVPKLIAIRAPDTMAMWVALPLTVFYKATYLPMKLLNDSAHFVIRLSGFKPQHKEAHHSEDEMRLILGQTQEQGDLSLGRLLMFDNLFDFGHGTVKQIMTPRGSVAALSVSGKWEDNAEIIRTRHFSRYPVYTKELDDAENIVLLKDMALTHLTDSRPPELSKLLKKPVILQETTSLERALKEFQEKRMHMALIRNSEGKLSGLLTLEDVLEELVGEIRDESETTGQTLLTRAYVPEASDLDIAPADRFEILRSLLTRLHTAKPVFDLEEAWKLVEQREKMLSCALGQGAAFPHARIASIKEPLIAFGRIPHGVEFPCLDKEPVKMVFLILTPFGDPSFQLRTLQQLAGMLSNINLRKKLLKAKKATDVSEIISTFERRVAL